MLTGLKVDDLIVLNPPDALEDGEEVHVKEVANPLAPSRVAENTSAPRGAIASESPH